MSNRVFIQVPYSPGKYHSSPSFSSGDFSLAPCDAVVLIVLLVFSSKVDEGICVDE